MKKSAIEIVIKLGEFLIVATIVVELVVGVLSSLSGCAHLAAMEPRARSVPRQLQAAVAVTSECGDGLSPDHVGSGVVISERHVLTAAHVVRCAAIPDVHVYFGEPDGRLGRRMHVIEEDLDRDVALLELSAADNFGEGFEPPVLGKWTPTSCIASRIPHDGVRCGPSGLLVAERRASVNVASASGTSGAGVYDEDGGLLGVVTTIMEKSTYYARVTGEWLRGIKETK